MSGIKVKLTNTNNKKNKLSKIYKVKLNKDFQINNDIDVNVGDIIKHKTDLINGKVMSIDNDKIIVLWEDNCKEKIKFFNFFNEIELIKNDIVFDNNINEQQHEVRSIKKNVQKQDINNELDDLYNNVFDQMDDNYDDIIDANPNKINEQILNRKAYSMEQKIEQKQISDIKEKAIMELIDLMKIKGMIIGESIEKAEKEKLLQMSDTEFENFKNSLISNKSLNGNNQLSEAELMLQKIKFGGPIIGGFDKDNISSSMTNQTREIVSRKNDDIVKESKLNLDGFRNLQGLTKPLQVQNQQKSMKENLSSAIADLGWTTVSKIY